MYILIWVFEVSKVMRVNGEKMKSCYTIIKKICGLQETQNQEKQLMDISNSVER